MEKEELVQKTVSEQVQEDLEKLQERQKLIEARIAKLSIFHEHLVIIHRYEGIETLTFLEVSEQTMGSRRRQSWYGKIMAISQVDCGDDVIEKKKKLFRVGNVVNFNPDSAWSLNIAGFEEIWALHVDNILLMDSDYDYVTYRKENMKKRFQAQSNMARMNWERQQAQVRAMEINEKHKGQKKNVFQG